MSLSRAGLCGCIVAFLFFVPLMHGAVVFNFDTDPTFETTPFTDTVSGLSATFGGEASVCDVASIGFVSLSGNALIQDFCVGGQSGPLSISFSSNLEDVSLDFATAGGPASLTLSAFENNTAVGSSVFQSIVPVGHFNGEGLAFFTGEFDRIVLSSSDIIAIDNVSATTVPEPSSLLLLLPVVVGLGWSRRFKRDS